MGCVVPCLGHRIRWGGVKVQLITEVACRMHEVKRKAILADGIVRLDVEAPPIARKRKAGQFVIVRAAEGGERIPLTICDADPQEGTITLIVQAAGDSTRKLCALEEGHFVSDIAGPLGLPTRIEEINGLCVCVGGGLGAAPLYPIAQAVHRKGVELISIIGARSSDLVILRREFEAISDQVLIATDDGSEGHRGFVSEVLADVIATHDVSACVAIGPVPMMKACAEVTRPAGIRTIVSLNPIMVDGTGMCGGCRVTVGGQTKFACVDGPEFDGHQVDFDELARRLRTYQIAEKHECQLAPELLPR